MKLSDQVRELEQELKRVKGELAFRPIHVWLDWDYGLPSFGEALYEHMVRGRSVKLELIDDRDISYRLESMHVSGINPLTMGV